MTYGPPETVFDMDESEKAARRNTMLLDLSEEPFFQQLPHDVVATIIHLWLDECIHEYKRRIQEIRVQTGLHCHKSFDEVVGCPDFVEKFVDAYDEDCRDDNWENRN
jgi:hypothetical protein